jgi:arylformamidase
LSAVNNLQYLVSPIYLSAGTLDTPEFQRQTRDFATLLRSIGKKVTYRISYGCAHMEVPESFANPYGVVGRMGLEMMGLEPNRGKKN